MFDYIKGNLVQKQQTSKGGYLTVEVGGIGYLIEVPSCEVENSPKIDSEIKVYTVLLHREDNMSLCGFLHREDRDIFKILTSVSGVGAKMALTLLNEFTSCEIISLVINGNFKELTRAKGVGPKLAQKMILELKDKLMNLQTVPIPVTSGCQDEQAVKDAQTVLFSLGYEHDEIKNAMSRAITLVKDQSNAEEVLKETLKILSM